MKRAAIGAFIMRKARQKKKRRQGKIKVRIRTEYAEQRHQLKSVPKRFAGVVGEVLQWMDCALDEENQTMIDMQFKSGKALLITVEAKPEIVAEWRRRKGGELESVPEKSFE
jgi:hypothetical protein